MPHPHSEAGDLAELRSPNDFTEGCSAAWPGPSILAGDAVVSEAQIVGFLHSSKIAEPLRKHGPSQAV